MSMHDRLGRLLFIVPYVAHRDGVPLSELAATLGVTPQQIEADLNLLSMVGKPPLTPDHLIDLYVEDDIVYVELDQSLSRPLRLTHEEAQGLVLGAKLMGRLGGWGDELNHVLDRILDVLNPVDRAMVQSLCERIEIGEEGNYGAEISTTLRTCAEQRVVIALDYYSASSDQAKTYQLKPLALLNHTGVEYLLARDMGARDHEKLFRLDRIGAVRPTTDTFTPPASLNLKRFRTQRLYFGQDTFVAEVRFSRHVAREVMERFSKDEVTQGTDGSIVVRLATSSVAWLARWVLRFGAEAEILSPAHMRDEMAMLCEDALRAYSAEPGVSPV